MILSQCLLNGAHLQYSLLYSHTLKLSAPIESKLGRMSSSVFCDYNSFFPWIPREISVLVQIQWQFHRISWKWQLMIWGIQKQMKCHKSMNNCEREQRHCETCKWSFKTIFFFCTLLQIMGIVKWKICTSITFFL